MSDLVIIDDHFYRRRTLLIARRITAFVGVYLAFHWWGLKAFPIMAYGIFLTYLIIRMEFSARKR